MSTQLRRLAQAPAHSPARAKFFLTLSDYSTDGNTVFVTTDSAVSSVMTVTQFDAATTGASPAVDQYTLLKDMGREIVVVDADNNHIQKWRAVQPVADSTTEGVATYSDVYVLVWAANGTAANIVRTG